MRRRNPDRGSITAETAVVLPALVLVAVMAIWLISAAVMALRCGDAAREGARALARGETAAHSRSLALAHAPKDADVSLASSGATVNVRVSAVVRPWAVFGHSLPGIPVSSDVTTASEGS